MDTHTTAALADGIYVAYADGSCVTNPGPGGCAFRLFAPDGQVTEKKRYSLYATSNQVKMQAVIEALEATPEGVSVLVCLDSGYIKDGSEKYLARWRSNGWRKADGNEVANRELWARIVGLSETREVKFHKITARSGGPDSDRVEALATKAAEKAASRAFCVERDTN